MLPGLLVAGFGIGMVLVPLSSTVVRGVEAQHAGSASGVLSTAQHVGGALGVAVVGVVFYRTLGVGTLGAGTTGGRPRRSRLLCRACTVSLYTLAALTVLTAGLVQLLPRAAAR